MISVYNHLIYSYFIILMLFMSKYSSILSIQRTIKGFSFTKHFSHAFYIDIGPHHEGIIHAASILQKGGLVAFPTETVYGLGANALNDSAVRSIFYAKKRPASDPLIVHITNISDMDKLFEYDIRYLPSSSSLSSIPKAKIVCYTLASSFWPGPLTLIQKAKSIIPSSVTAGTGYVGIRYPRHPIAQALIQQAGIPIAAPSANRFGHVSPTLAEHVMEDLGDEKIAILRDKSGMQDICDVGIESTVCKISSDGNSVSILRCGAITSIDISNALISNNIICTVTVDNEKSIGKLNVRSVGEENGAIAPGQMIKHYSPDIPTYILSKYVANLMTSTTIQDTYDFIISSSSSLSSSLLSRDTIQINLSHTVIIDYSKELIRLKPFVKSYTDLSIHGNIEEAYRNIFQTLRQSEQFKSSSLDQPCYLLLVDLSEISKQDEKIRALWERIHRAASGNYLISE